MQNRNAQLMLVAVLAAMMLVLGCEKPQETPKTETKAEPLKEEAVKEEAPMAAEAPKRKRPAFEDIDADKDGFLTKAELDGFFFKRVDTDGDGKISKEEHAAYRAKKKGHGCPHAKKEGGCENCPHKAQCECPDCKGCAEKGECTCEKCKDCPACQGKTGECPYKKRTFEECDANSDGFVTPEEFKKGERLLAKKDTDKDGKISKEEWGTGKKGCGCGGHGKHKGHEGHGHGSCGGHGGHDGHGHGDHAGHGHGHGHGH